MKIRFSANRLPLSWVIRAYTFSSVSHAEFIFSDGVMIYPSVEARRVILTKKVKYSREYIFDLDVTPEQEQMLRYWAESQLGTGYDWTSLAPWNIFIKRKKKTWKDPSYWMCSEFCAAGLELLGIELFSDTHKKILPSELFKAIQNHQRATLEINK